MKRTAIVVPGSSSWWLVSMSPLIFFDSIRVSTRDIESVLQQGGNSSFHERAAKALEILLSNAEDQIILKDPSLPREGRTPTLEKQAKHTASTIITEAEKHSPQHPALINPHEIKRAMRIAYRHWITYNRQKLRTLRKGESLAKVLKNEQIPQSLENLRKIESTRAKDIVDLLTNNTQLHKVLDELARNAILITSLAPEGRSKVYDSLIEEFLPTIELVERIRILNDLPEKIGRPQDITLLWKLYNFRLKKIRSSPEQRASLYEAFTMALKERKRYNILRQRLTEFDALLAESRKNPDKTLNDVLAFVKDINSIIARIDTAGTWAMWGSSTYLFSEITTSLSPDIQLLIKSALFNPLAIKRFRETIENLYFLKKGISPEFSNRISLIRDFATVRQERSNQFTETPREEFKFWV